MTERGLMGILSSLEAVVRKLEVRSKPSTWSDYYSTCSYSPQAVENKKRLVNDHLARIGPGTVWDLGANLGWFSEIARDHADTVVAMEQDPVCVDSVYRSWRAKKTEILPLVVDLANPSPALGWAHEERASLAGRGPADTALALALVHHLSIGNNVPFVDLASFMASVSRHLVIEFVPKQDPMVQLLLRSRKDVFSDYSRNVFEETFAEHFKIHRSDVCTPSGRTLYLMETR